MASQQVEPTTIPSSVPLRWGNSQFVNLFVGQTHDFAGRTVRLVEVFSDRCVIDIAGERAELIVARRQLPTIVSGVRVFLADNRPVASLTTDTFTPSRRVHGMLQADALLCLSDAEKPLLDPKRYAFPISTADGFRWEMLEDSHMFAYLGPNRSHEGIDFDLHDARGVRKHALVAVEDAQVILADNRRDGCIILRSHHDPHICYVYRHLDGGDSFLVRQGEHVQRGQKLGYAWGDQRWGHLHFAVRFADTTPTIGSRYDDLLSCFPQCYELWHGDVQLRRKVWPNGNWRFFWKNYWEVGNRKLCDDYNPIAGRGWELGPACASRRVECDLSRGGDEANLTRSVLLRRTLHAGTAAEYIHDADFYRFRVDVPAGHYAVRAVVGDLRTPTWQRMKFNDVDAGAYALEPGQFATSPVITTQAETGILVIDLFQRDPNTYSAISELHFVRIE